MKRYVRKSSFQTFSKDMFLNILIFNLETVQQFLGVWMIGKRFYKPKLSEFTPKWKRWNLSPIQSNNAISKRLRRYPMSQQCHCCQWLGLSSLRISGVIFEEITTSMENCCIRYVRCIIFGLEMMCRGKKNGIMASHHFSCC